VVEDLDADHKCLISPTFEVVFSDAKLKKGLFDPRPASLRLLFAQEGGQVPGAISALDIRNDIVSIAENIGHFANLIQMERQAADTLGILGANGG